ncbi:hypothetical protein CEXT_71011 [Caerostris extrusa]|uniref:Uncharacterized protein n=1 Tax=Caerostris extrusa TaxID=172846 RepID=A0AAV4MV74_CAEEX|nr:hypothetical protein CEXT_71011 [Caerostris extrusa]
MCTPNIGMTNGAESPYLGFKRVNGPPRYAMIRFSKEPTVRGAFCGNSKYPLPEMETPSAFSGFIIERQHRAQLRLILKVSSAYSEKHFFRRHNEILKYLPNSPRKYIFARIEPRIKEESSQKYYFMCTQ